jgi:hypothetical protein
MTGHMPPQNRKHTGAQADQQQDQVRTPRRVMARKIGHLLLWGETRDRVTEGAYLSEGQVEPARKRSLHFTNRREPKQSRDLRRKEFYLPRTKSRVQG